MIADFQLEDIDKMGSANNFQNLAIDDGFKSPADTNRQLIEFATFN